MDLPELLTSLRRDRGLSQGGLADRLCDLSGRPTVTRTEVSRYERGVRTPSSYWRHWLAVALDVPVTVLEHAATAEKAPVAS